LREEDFLETVFKIIEHLTRSELRVSSKKLILYYLKDSGKLHLQDRAREAIRRYTYYEIPTLQGIREKAKREELTLLDHLVLKMEYMARQG